MSIDTRTHESLRKQRRPFALFDAHLHIVDPRYPLVANNGFVPAPFTVHDYLQRMAQYDLAGGAVVSGSFQAFDQSYLLAALEQLGNRFVGVTQLRADVSDRTLLDLDAAGVRAVRFNLRRGGSEDARHVERVAHRVHALVGWHVELYVDAAELAALEATLVALPAVSIDHLGLSAAGLPTLIRLVERGVRVKATGFGRVDFAVADALRRIDAIDPGALMFGTDLPSTRAPRPYDNRDFDLVADTLGADAARRVLYDNARDFYRPRNASRPGETP